MSSDFPTFVQREGSDDDVVMILINAENYKRLSSGILIEDIFLGTTGTMLNNLNQEVVISYRCFAQDSKLISTGHFKDSSAYFSRELNLKKDINEALLGMRLAGYRRIIIPPEITDFGEYRIVDVVILSIEIDKSEEFRSEEERCEHFLIPEEMSLLISEENCETSLLRSSEDCDMSFLLPEFCDIIKEVGYDDEEKCADKRIKSSSTMKNKCLISYEEVTNEIYKELSSDNEDERREEAVSSDDDDDRREEEISSDDEDEKCATFERVEVSFKEERRNSKVNSQNEKAVGYSMVNIGTVALATIGILQVINFSLSKYKHTQTRNTYVNQTKPHPNPEQLGESDPKITYKLMDEGEGEVISKYQQGCFQYREAGTTEAMSFEGLPTEFASKLCPGSEEAMLEAIVGMKLNERRMFFIPRGVSGLGEDTFLDLKLIAIKNINPKSRM